MTIWGVTDVCRKGCEPNNCKQDEGCFNHLVCLKVPPGVSPIPPTAVPSPAKSSSTFPWWKIIGGGVGVTLLLIVLIYFIF